ncbi:Molybdopterin or thiamine biosynthesis adenylyltransferase [Halobacillus karajensis]|uniref:Molybdopterin-synthase adenylyltransferase n=1 Tax=Halobacillus karajensis TaxID=195088 RepID=A0A024P6L0_9BACI|nr:ThiF family adenylyltransferase [Halobacillus karajensis]CDQ18164.1 Molybdopterin-synthase adenylyltransferase [Halobacillus karajensis]CDQ24515.1 Molybdopterin-synthase adenylyltransferase [Halobacillus karajensis]CDQ29237.1 Molybdopterin-synthase adenylyltransferase [Halobacillus karajensis]SEH58041.1 Molybdopterin or thiamine biosynthesis adenylyltransferase [Halobacillus karajensis]
MSERYSRQERFAPIGKEGQAALMDKHAFIVGAGALGSANAEMLARAGVGNITIIDRDYIEWSNLGRQQLYTEEDAASMRTKAKAAEQKLKSINSSIRVRGMIQEFNAENAEDLLEGVDILIDGTDNFRTRLVINDATSKRRVPWVYGGCLQSYGLVLSIIPGETPCLQCLIDYIPDQGGTCDTVGIIGPAVQTTAAYQTAECLKFLTGHPMSPEMVSFDVWGRNYSSINVSKLIDTACPSCSKEAVYPYLNKEKGLKSDRLCGRNTVHIRPAHSINLSFPLLTKDLETITSKVKESGEILSFQIEEKRFVVFKDGRTLIHGTDDVKEAKELYQRYIKA